MYISIFVTMLECGGSVLLLKGDPAYIAWLLPTVLGSPLIAYFQLKYKKKKKLSTISPTA